MKDAGVTFIHDGKLYKGVLQYVLGSGDHTWHLMIGDFHWGRLRKPQDQWIFDPTSTTRELIGLTEYFGKCIDKANGPMRLIIAGGRDFSNYDLVKERLDYLLKNITDPIEIVSGRCDRGALTFTTDSGIEVFGADGLGERFAKEKGYPVNPFPADWSTHGRAAGPIRNLRMAEYGSHLVAFWDGKSKGTKSMIDIAAKNGLNCKTVTINPL